MLLQGMCESYTCMMWLLPFAVAVVSWSLLLRCGHWGLFFLSPAGRGSRRAVSQILGGEVVQRCRGHGSCERSDIVSLIIDSFA